MRLMFPPRAPNVSFYPLERWTGALCLCLFWTGSRHIKVINHHCRRLYLAASLPIKRIRLSVLPLRFDIMSRDHTERCFDRTSMPCKLFQQGICRDGYLCLYRHDPRDVTLLQLCNDFGLTVPPLFLYVSSQGTTR